MLQYAVASRVPDFSVLKTNIATGSLYMVLLSGPSGDSP